MIMSEGKNIKIEIGSRQNGQKYVVLAFSRCRIPVALLQAYSCRLREQRQCCVGQTTMMMGRNHEIRQIVVCTTKNGKENRSADNHDSIRAQENL